MDVAEMSCLRSMCRMIRRDRVRDEQIRRRCGLQRSLSERGEAAALRWVGHIERMEEERLVKKLYRAEVESNRGEVEKENVDKWSKRVFELIELTIPGAKKCVKDRRE